MLCAGRHTGAGGGRDSLRAMTWRLLEGVPDEEMNRLLSVARRRVFARNEVVFHQGDPGAAMHLIRTGRFAVRIRTAVGDAVTVAILGPGETFGELALVGEDDDRSAAVVALERAETLSIARTDLARLRSEQPQVNDLLVRLLAARIRRTNALLAEALYLPADQRVLRRLRELAELYRSGEGGVVIPLTQEEIAELAGTSRATVNRVLRAEQRAGTLERTRGRTIVVDAARLGDGLRRRPRQETAAQDA
jgi:CRP/FNR family cyclic AMP-dependent transcriptional regulator